MEFILYSTITITIWMLSVSCLLPFLILLKFSKTIRDKWFSWFYVRVLYVRVGPALDRVRKYAFEVLQEHLPNRKKNTNYEILEIGFGAGPNLPFYPKDVNLTVLDMNESFIKYFEESKQKNPQINYKKLIIAMAEDMHEIEDDSFDIVICTYVLCSVKSVRAAVEEVKRVLKPGGKVLFLEHIKYPSYTWQGVLQSLTHPLWNIYCNGCYIIRNHDEEIERVRFSNVVTKRIFPKDVWLYVRPMIIYIATK